MSTLAAGYDGSRRRWRKRLEKIGGTIAWHGVMLVVCAFVLIPIVMVVLGSFKSVDQFFDKPYGLPNSFDFFNYRKAWDEADLQTALREALESMARHVGAEAGSLWTCEGSELLCLASIGVISLLAAADSTTTMFSEAKMGIAAHMWVSAGVDKETAENLQLAAQIIAAVLQPSSPSRCSGCRGKIWRPSPNGSRSATRSSPAAFSS